LSRLAHQIKPSFGLMGMDDLRKAVFVIEQSAADETNLSGLVDGTTQFIRDCKAVIAALAEKSITR
jgi:hypothetical protein